MYFEICYLDVDKNSCDCDCCRRLSWRDICKHQEPIHHYHDELIAGFRRWQRPEVADSDKSDGPAGGKRRSLLYLLNVQCFCA